MAAYLQQLVNLLVVPPGNLVYHLIVAFSVVGALQASLQHWQRSGFPQGRRMVVGLTLLLITRLALFLISGIALQGLIDEHLLPPIDRAITLLSLVIIIWLWVFPEPVRLGDTAAVLLGLLTFTLMIFGILWWSTQNRDLPYNGSWLDFIGEVIILVLLIASSLALVWRRPNGWVSGLIMFSLFFAGHLAHLVLTVPAGDYSGLARLMQMAAYPLLLVLPQRFPLHPVEQPAKKQQPQVQERRRFGAEPHIVRSFLDLSTETDPAKICQAITRTVAHTMLADLCLLVSPPYDNGQIVLQCGYDLIREENLGGATLSTRSVPVIEAALRRGRSLRLPASSTSPDLVNLAHVLNLGRAGHLLASPILGDNGETLAELILLSPYSDRGWSSEDQAFLTELAVSLAQLMQRAQTLASVQNEMVQASRTLQETQTETDQARRERDDLLLQMAKLHDQAGKEHSQIESLTALINAQEEARQNTEKSLQEARLAVARLQAEIRRLQQGGAEMETFSDRPAARGEIPTAPRTAPQTEPPAETRPLEGELRLALEEIARLQAELSAARAEAGRSGLAPGPATPDPLFLEKSEAIASIAQDLRQPTLSIINNADLLLKEREVIPGELQRRFLERIRISTERISRLVDDLIQVASQETPRAPRAAGAVSLSEALDRAVAQTGGQRLEKDIALRIDLPERLPAIRAGQDTLQEIFIKLLQNAVEATRDGGEVALRALVKNSEDDREYVLVQVSDQGEGIPPDDLPRLFSSLYHPGTDGIQGIGEPCAELSHVKTLVEALDGRIWVDSQPGTGSVFSVLLPASPNSHHPQRPGGPAA